jgi:hypothetical protein
MMASKAGAVTSTDQIETKAKGNNQMGNEIKKYGAALPAASDGWSSVPNAGNNHIRGTIMKFNGVTGHYTVSGVNFDINEKEFVATGILTCWVCWLAGQNRPAQILPTLTGQRHPSVAELPVMPTSGRSTTVCRSSHGAIAATSISLHRRARATG